MTRTALLFSIGLVISAVAQTSGQSPVFQAETRIVEVAIVARDSDGSPVPDLTADDFRVFDNGVEQKIQSFDKLWDPPRAPNGLPIGLPPKRPTVIVWNTIGSDSDWLSRFRERDAIAAMLHDLPQTVDRIEILALGDELKTIHDFSPFTGVLRTAILEFDWQPPAMPYGNRQMWMLKTISNLAHDLSRIRGEKNLIWIGGLSARGSGNTGSGGGGGRGGFSLGRSGAGPGPARGGNDGAPATDYYQDMARVMQELSEARVMFYPVNPSMVKPFELDDFAQLTGGKAYWEDKDLAGLLRDAIDDSRDGYMLTYVPNNYQRDGSGHEVKVKITRKGVDLRYRPGYAADPAVK